MVPGHHTRHFLPVAPHVEAVLRQEHVRVRCLLLNLEENFAKANRPTLKIAMTYLAQVSIEVFIS